MLKTFEEWLAEKGITTDGFLAKELSEKAVLQKGFLQYVSETLKTSQDSVQDQLKPEELAKAMKEELEKLVPKEDLDAFKQRVEDAEESIKIFKENGGRNGVQKSFAEQIKEQILAKSDEWATLKNDKNANITFTMKAPADMLVSTNTTGRVARIEVDSDRVGIARRNPFMLEIVGAGATSAATVYWLQRVNHDGAPAFTAEGAAKAQVDWDYVESSAPTRKVTAYAKISKEMMDDIDNIAQDIALELTEQIQLTADANILTGDGSGQNLTGVAENATAFAPGTALLNTVSDANDMDVLRAAVAQVYRNNFVPNRILLHPDKIASMEMEKGSDGHYVLPPFMAANGTAIGGVQIVANNGVANTSFYVGDFTKYKAKIREGLSIAIGYDGDDWTKNMMTPLAEMRLVGYIASNNYGAIVSGTFAVGKALLDPTVADA